MARAKQCRGDSKARAEAWGRARLAEGANWALHKDKNNAGPLTTVQSLWSRSSTKDIADHGAKIQAGQFVFFPWSVQWTFSKFQKIWFKSGRENKNAKKWFGCILERTKLEWRFTLARGPEDSEVVSARRRPERMSGNTVFRNGWIYSYRTTSRGHEDRS